DRRVETKRLRGLEIDDQLEFGGLLDRQIARLVAPEDAIDVRRGAPVELDVLDAVGRKSTPDRVVTVSINVGKPVPHCQRNNEVAMHHHQRAWQRDAPAVALSRELLDCTTDFGNAAHPRDGHVYAK